MRRQDGSISISVLQTEEQKYAYRGNDIPTSDVIIALSEPGEYCIEINAKNFRGNYGISDCPETQKGEHHDKTCYQNKKMQRQNPIPICPSKSFCLLSSASIFPINSLTCSSVFMLLFPFCCHIFLLF